MKIDKKFLDKIPLKLDVLHVAVLGSKEIDDYEFIKKKIDYYIKNTPKQIVIVSGGDSSPRRYAEENNLRLIEFLSIVQNEDIIIQSDCCIAFLKKDSLETLNSIEEAKKRDIPLRIVNI